MGTTFRVVLYAADAATAKKAADAVFARVAELDNCMSDYKPDQRIDAALQVFATKVGEPVKVSDDLFFVLSKAQELSKKSNGAFDVTVGPVVQLWRLARRTQELPDPKEFAAAREGRLPEGEARCRQEDRATHDARHAARSRRHRQGICRG